MILGIPKKIPKMRKNPKMKKKKSKNEKKSLKLENDLLLWPFKSVHKLDILKSNKQYHKEDGFKVHRNLLT